MTEIPEDCTCSMWKGYTPKTAPGLAIKLSNHLVVKENMRVPSDKGEFKMEQKEEAESAGIIV
ncbi:hypothetical protein CU098_007023 [Rhizopus stolonifer]|uniref:Uncharacterized protein n=1 Tax=Rhizopus stolonifer TaxID=4846 RepID=A0A367J2E2_RHIST|nr:hypothetical protein CU098_007023 [Rhizopus stolonifer]